MDGSTSFLRLMCFLVLSAELLTETQAVTIGFALPSANRVKRALREFERLRRMNNKGENSETRLASGTGTPRACWAFRAGLPLLWRVSLSRARSFLRPPTSNYLLRRLALERKSQMWIIHVNPKTGITVLYQLITTSQNKWKEGWIKSDEKWKQTWINSALKFIC